MHKGKIESLVLAIEEEGVPWYYNHEILGNSCILVAPIRENVVR